MPFVQGHLKNESVAVTIRTECAHCSRPMRIEVDDEIRCSVAEEADPLIFIPIVDFERLKDPNIIDAF